MSSREEFHALLDELSDGDHVAVTLTTGGVEVFTINGPVSVEIEEVWIYDVVLRHAASDPVPMDVLSISATFSDTVTETSGDLDALARLIDSTEEGERVTAVFHRGDAAAVFTGSIVRGEGADLMLNAPFGPYLRYYDGGLASALYSVTATRKVTKTW